jgi:hypothetical protein
MSNTRLEIQSCHDIQRSKYSLRSQVSLLRHSETASLTRPLTPNSAGSFGNKKQAVRFRKFVIKMSVKCLSHIKLQQNYTFLTNIYTSIKNP